MTTNTNSAQERTASIDLAQLDKLPTYDPERDTPGMMELRSEFNDGDYFKVEDVRALARRASAMPSSKDAGGEHRIRSWGGNEITLESLLESLHTYSRIMPGAEGRAKWAMREAAAYIEATRATPVHPAAAPSDPMDWPLPCDVKVGGVNIRQGCKLRTLVARMESLHRMAVKAIPAPTPEARAMIDAMISGESADAAAKTEKAPCKTCGGRGELCGVGAWYQCDDCKGTGKASAAGAGSEQRSERETLQFIHDTFKRDLDQGYKTKDKEFAVSIAAEALARAPLPAQDGQAVDDARDAARYRWLRENCYDYEPAGEGDAFDHPSLHFESSELDPYDSASLNWAVDAAMSASRPDDKGEKNHG